MKAGESLLAPHWHRSYGGPLELRSEVLVKRMCRFCDVAVIILDPSTAPVVILNSPVSRSSEMEEEIDDCGRFPGWM